MRSVRRSGALFTGLVTWSLVAAGPALAHDWTLGDTVISLGGYAGIGVFSVPDANFGAGSYDIRAVRDFAEGLRNDIGRAKRSPIWVEGFVKPSLRFSQPLGGSGTLFGEVSAVASQTLGDGDASIVSFTRGNPGSVGIEQAYVGFRIQPPFGLKGDSVAIQLGRQDFVLDDGFLIHLGRYNLGRIANFYLSPRQAFDGWGTLRINTSPIRGDIFVLSTPVDNKAAYGNRHLALDQPNTDFAGFDLEWFNGVDRKGANPSVNYLDRSRYLNFTYFYIFDSDRNPLLYSDASTVFWARRKGLHVLSLSGGGNLIPTDALKLRKNGTLYFQYVRELNGTRGRRVDATAFYIEPGYQFLETPWQPALSYRYAYFSGNRTRLDEPLGVKHSYDPLFYGGGFRDYLGNWGLGEIVGTYMQFSSNIVVHQAELKVTAPFHLASKDDRLEFELLAYQFLFDKTRSVGTTSRRFAREVDVSARYIRDERTSVALTLGAAFPQKGGREWFDSQTAIDPEAHRARHNSYLAEIYFIRNF